MTLSAGGEFPYDGYASIDLLAINPGATGLAKVKISGSFDSATLSELAACATQTTCSFPDGTVYVNGGASANIDLGGKGAVPFSVSVDSSSNPVDIYVGMNANSEMSTMATFTITLNIEFQNQ